MITAVDTSVLLDILGGAEPFGPASRAALRHAAMDGALIASEVVWAETSAWFGSQQEAQRALTALVRFVPSDLPSTLAAGSAWRQYRAVGGPRTRLLPDFLIGAHALRHADRLLTRDRGFFRRYFSTLTIVDPTTRAG